MDWTRHRIATVADVEAIEAEMPADARTSFTTTYEIFAAGAAKFGDRPAITFLPTGSADDDPVVVSYAELFAGINRAANLFHDLGVSADNPVSYLLPNLPQTHLTIWGGETAGIVNAVNPLLRPDQIVEIMEAAGSRVLVTLGPVPGTDIWDKVAEVRRLYPQLDTVLHVGGGDVTGALSFDAELAKRPGDRLTFQPTAGSDTVCAYFHTGGTTGSPKLAQHSHGGEVYMAWGMAIAADLGPDDVLLLGLPLFHVNAVMVTGLGPFMVGANTVLLSPAGYRNPNVIRDFWKIVERYRATFFSAVPTICAALLDVPVAGADLSSLRFAIVGAAPLPVELFRAFEEVSGVTIMEGYGLTEGTTASCLNPPYGERRIGSIGIRFPYQQVKCAIVGDDGRFVRDCKTDEIGVICIKGPNVIPGYVQEKFNPQLFADEGWLNTGDLARQDTDGYFWLVGRAKDLIIRGGHNIDPQAIEEALHTHPKVALAAAVGKPDSYAGEVPVAYVALKPGEQADPEDLRAWAAEHVPERPAAPQEVFILDEMPVTAVGKIFKPSLRYDITRRVYTAALEAALGDSCGFEVSVGPHESHGTMARVTLRGGDGQQRRDLEAEVARALGAYAIGFTLDWA